MSTRDPTPRLRRAPPGGDAAPPGRLGRRLAVVLRPPRADDAREFLRLQAASERHFGHWMSAIPSLAAFEKWLERTQREHYDANLLCAASDGAILGGANLSQIFGGPFRNACLGYWIGAPYAGRGLMRQGLDLVLRRAFRELGLHRVEANIQPDNRASIALVRRLGFREEGFSPRYLKVCGRWRDHERWAILKEEWAGGRSVARAVGPLDSSPTGAPADLVS